MGSFNGILVDHLPMSHSFITIDNDNSILVFYCGTAFLPTAISNFMLKSILVAPNLVHNLLLGSSKIFGQNRTTVE
jgi:hypothetical protein